MSLLEVNMGPDNFFRQVLPNGMTVVFEKRASPLVAVSVGVNFGSGHEALKFKGLAHYIEHAVFKGTKRRTALQITEEIEKKGGVINAYTDEEITSFWTKIRSKYFDNAMDILSDIVINPTFNKAEMDMERKVVLEEIKMHHDNPKYYVLDKLKEQLFPSPFGISGLGNDKIIKKITKATLTRYHNINYNPSNMVIAIVGNADVDKIWNDSKKMFSKGLVQKQIDKPKIITEGGAFGKIIEKRRGIDQTSFALGFHAPSRSSNLKYAAEIFNTALGVGMSSKLFQEIREKKGLAYDISSWLDNGKDYGYIFVNAGIQKGKTELVKKTILEEIKKFQNWNSKELDEAKEELLGHKEFENERAERVADALVREQMIGDAKVYYQYEEKLKAVTLEDIKKVADIKDYALVSLSPETLQ